jgi:hypothetical protein
MIMKNAWIVILQFLKNIFSNAKTAEIKSVPSVLKNVDVKNVTGDIKKMEVKEFKSAKNKFLRINPDVILTSSIDLVAYNLDSFFRMANKIRYATSGKREPKGQLQLIINYARKYNIPVIFTADDVNVKILKTGNYIWLEVYSKLLVEGLIIAAPCECKCLYDYKNAAGETIKAGTIKKPSPHFLGTALDIGGGSGQEGEEAKTIDDEIEIVENAMKQNPNIGIVTLVKERENNCLHINVKNLEV